MDEFEELDQLLGEFGFTETGDVEEPTVPQAGPDVTDWEEDGDETSTEVDVVSGYIDQLDGQEAEDSESASCVVMPACKCATPCMDQFPKERIEQHVLSLREMTKTEREMFMLASLQKTGTDETRRGKRQRVRYRFTHDGQKVCKPSFCVINDIGKETLKALQRHLSTKGPVPRVHGNAGRKPHNALRYMEVKSCVDFLVNFADLHGLPMPAPLKGRGDCAPVLLPTVMTKSGIHKEYMTACGDTEVRALGLSSFKDIWKHCIPHIKIMKPAEDVCSKCELTRKKVADAVTEADKLVAAKQLQEHIQDAQTERAVYKSSILAATQEIGDYTRPVGPIPPMSTDRRHAHYTFDYCQNVALPQHSRQIGPLYFLTKRKVHIFGIRNDSLSRQYNYLIEEDQSIGTDGTKTHGPDAVISMLHHFLFRHGLGEKGCVLHADNCGGQNKNRYVLAYLSWRIHRGLHDDITLTMQIPGHTKCLVDAGFGHIKKLYRRSECESLAQLAAIINKSAHSNVAVMFRNTDDEQTWMWYDWKNFLARHFMAFNGIRKYQHFRFTSADKEAVYVKERANSQEIRVKLTKSGAEIRDDHPSAVAAAGLTKTRQQYLYKHIRPFVRPECQDDVCPMLQEE